MERGKIIICLVIPALHIGGMERVMSELANQFSTYENTEIHLVLYGKNRDVFYEIPASIIMYRPAFLFEKHSRLVSTIKTLFFLRTTLKEIQADAILSFGEMWNNLVLLSSLGLRLPVFVSDRCQPDKSWGKLHDFLRKKLYPTAKGIISQTETAKQIFLKQCAHFNVKVIGNPIKRIELKKHIKREKIVLSVGRLIKSKNYDVLIALFMKVRKPGWKLIIVGDDALNQQNKVQLQSLINKNMANNFIELAGKRQNVAAYYLKSSVFAFTSSSEGFPNVIGEALSAGLPVVAFDCVAGPSEMIQDGENGFLVPLFNQDFFERKLEKLMEDDVLREKMSKKAPETMKVFSSKEVAAKFYNFILK
jgi:glycosyltransferase involved in cell wall biosynthesis